MRKQIGALKRISFAGCVFLLLYFAFSLEAYAFIRGDINRDDRVGLPEAIYALQMTAGARDAIASKVINVPGDFSTIQEAVDATIPGDTINVAAGTYTGSILII